MDLSGQLQSLFDEDSWGLDSSFRTSIYKIQSGFTSYGSFAGGDSKDYYAITPGIGDFTLYVTGDSINGFPNSEFSFEFGVTITDSLGNVLLTSSSYDVYTRSISFSSTSFDTYYVEISNTLFDTFSYAATLVPIVPIDATPPTVAAFNPADGATNVGIASNIVVTFSESIQFGSGAIVLKTDSGATVATYIVGSSGNLTISGSTLTINPASDLSFNTGYKVEFESGTINDLAGNGFVGTTSYNFTTADSTTTVDLTYAGTDGPDTISGSLGSDTMIGGLGNDTYVVNSTGDVVVEAASAGTDTVSASISYILGTNVEKLTLTGSGNLNGTGNTLNNTLTGNAGNNTLNASGGNDLLSGGAGNDTLIGGPGIDKLVGGTAKDFFIFNTKLGVGNVDTITGFSHVDDTIRLDDDIFKTLATGRAHTLPAARYKENATGQATDADDRIIYNNSTGALYYDPDGTGPAAAIKFAVIAGGPDSVDFTDFTVVT